MIRAILILALLAIVSALRTTPSMLFGGVFGNKKPASSSTAAAPVKAGVKTPVKPAAKAPAKSASWQMGTGSQNKGTYIPEGLTKAQYDAQLAAEQKKKMDTKKRFPLGKNAETLQEWMEKEAKKGNTGKDLLMRGHRLVKTKYPEWYTDESPV